MAGDFRDDTDQGGTWYLEYVPLIMQLIRAKGAGATSTEVKVQTRPTVSLGQRPPGMFFVNVNSQRGVWRKRVSLQRFDREERVWREIRKVQLTETARRPASAMSRPAARRSASQVPKGTTLRAVLPLSQTRPCYLAGYSNLLRSEARDRASSSSLAAVDGRLAVPLSSRTT